MTVIDRLKTFHEKRATEIDQAASVDASDKLRAHLAALPPEVHFIGILHKEDRLVDVQYSLLPGNIYFNIRYFIDGSGHARIGSVSNPIDDPLFWEREHVIRGIYEAIALNALPHRIHWETL